MPKTFICPACHKEKPVTKGLQPVPVAGQQICQHCWSSATWGKEWADQCESQRELDRLLEYLRIYPGSPDCPGPRVEITPEKEVAWASSLIQAWCFRSANSVNAFSSFLHTAYA